MRILFIRHAESVDNVANCFGGSRDVALTAHGVLQAQRLAFSLVASKLDVKRIFSSNLQRAVSTACAVCDACNALSTSGGCLEVTQLSELREKHFGNWEGMKFGVGAADSRPAQTDAETSQSMRDRAEAFLDLHLSPLLQHIDKTDGQSCIVVVSHGIMLSTISHAFMAKVRAATTGAVRPVRAQVPFVRLSWSNTGYLDVVVETLPDCQPAQSNPWSHLELQVIATNCTTHLAGLRKTRGGIGSAAFDQNQMTIERFFSNPRKRKADGPAKSI